MIVNDKNRANQAAIAFKANDRQQVVAIINDLIQRNASLGQDWGRLARMATIIGEVSLALEAARRYAETNPSDPQTQLSRAGMLAENGRIRDAISLIKPLALKAPDNAALHHFLGTVLSQLGDKKSALKSLRRALKIWEMSGHTWLTLAAIKKFSVKDRDLAKLRELQAAMSTMPPQVQAPYLYALGKALDDIGQTDAAFAAFAKGASIMRQNITYDPKETQGYIHNILQKFNASGINSLTPSNVTNNRPIFVMGWPRTGTTLVEQILTSHSAVNDGCELNLFRTASSALKGFTFDHAQIYEENFAKGKNPWSQVADNYLHLLEERFGDEGRIVDKSLNNSRFLGLIHHIFPNAPIIWMKRNPSDAAWSCFKTFFNKGLEWSWSFSDIAHHFTMEDLLLNHWVKQFPDAILQVPYEQLVCSPEIWIPKILDHCDLKSEKNVYSFHKTKRTILTASVEQVRRPMTQTSINASDKYIHHMTSFVENYFHSK